MFGPNREWVPLAIGAVVLLLCAILLFVGGLVVSQLLALYITPVFYIYMERFRNLGKKRTRRQAVSTEVVLQS